MGASTPEIAGGAEASHGHVCQEEMRGAETGFPPHGEGIWQVPAVGDPQDQ